MSNVKTRCPNCRKAYQISEDHLGRQVRCKNCSHTFTLEMSADETRTPHAPREGRPHAEREEYGNELPPHSPATPQPHPLTAPEQPKTIGPYTICRKLGAGGMGVVWLAHDPALERDVALKVLPPEYAKDEQYLKRFLREARAAAKLNHPNTVTIYQVGTDGPLLYLAMELLDGVSLDKLVESGQRIHWRGATRAILDAAAGLAAAHEIGLIHRDVKPANLMRNSKGVTKVVDFGLVRGLAADTQLTQQGMFLGTPNYMAPEQWLGQEADARTDIYSLACTYYHLLTGEAPYQAPTGLALGYQHRYEPFPDVRRLVPDLPPAACRILARGAAKEPEKRYQSAAELIAELEKLLAAPEAALERLETPSEILETPEVLEPPAVRHSSRDSIAAAEVRQAPPVAPAQAPPRAEERHLWITEQTENEQVAPQTFGEVVPQKLQGDGGDSTGFVLWVAVATVAGVFAVGVALDNPVLAATGVYLLAAVAIPVVLVVSFFTTGYGKVKIKLGKLKGKVAVTVDGDMIVPDELEEPIALRTGKHQLDLETVAIASGTLRRFSKSFSVSRGVLEIVVSLEPDGSLSITTTRDDGAIGGQESRKSLDRSEEMNGEPGKRVGSGDFFQTF